MKIAIVHYRAGRTDGVSLEIEKRRKLLQELGHTVRIVSGPIHEDSDYVIDELEFDHPEIRSIKEQCFAHFQRPPLPTGELEIRIEDVASRIEQSFLSYCQRERFDLVMVHNIFSHGRHPACALAFARLLNKSGLPAIATHHDFYWEHTEYSCPSCVGIRNYLDTVVPPASQQITQVTINSLARAQLLKRRGIDSTVIGDILDFEADPWAKDSFNADLPDRLGLQSDDLLVLQATRIVRRKGIENAARFVKTLDALRHELIGKRLYNGKTITKRSNIVLMLAGYVEESATGYLAQLKAELERLGIRALFADDIIGATRIDGARKRYSLWDAYAHADLVSYPSLAEGWGNQFLEAVFARRPVVLFEYPVFCADIKSEGYRYISLGNTASHNIESGLTDLSPSILTTAARNAIDVLTSPRTAADLEHNFQTGRRHHGLHVLRDFLVAEISKLGG
jgi:glycosyltransferase involved in cell wall biosynthesis